MAKESKNWKETVDCLSVSSWKTSHYSRCESESSEGEKSSHYFSEGDDDPSDGWSDCCFRDPCCECCCLRCRRRHQRHCHDDFHCHDAWWSSCLKETSMTEKEIQQTLPKIHGSSCVS